MKYLFEFKDYLNVNFWKWFGKSKMVDKNGKPLICYHGTNRKFDEFKLDAGHTHDQGYYGYGIYFTFGNGKFSKEEASYYGSQVIEAYLKVENPFDFSKLLDYNDTHISIMGLSSMVFLYNISLLFPEISNQITTDKITWNGSDGTSEDIPISVLPKLVDKYKKKLKYFEGEDNRGDKFKSGYVKSEVIEYDYTDKGGKKGSYIDYEELGKYTHDTDKNTLEIGLIFDAIEKYEGIKAAYHPEGYMTRYEIISDTIKKKGYDGIVQSMSGDEVVVFNPNQIKAVNNKGSFNSNNPKINENINNKLKNLPPDAIDLIDIISMNPTKPEYQKYKDILKDKFKINYDLEYGTNDSDLIKNANLKDIKEIKDFLDYDNYKKYCKDILRLRGFKDVDVFYENEISSKPITEEDIKKLSETIGFNIIKKEYNGSGTLAWIEGVDTIAYTEYVDVYYIIHEIGHIIDHKLYKNKVDLKYSNKSTYSLTSYGTTAGGESFAENFAAFILIPDKLKKILPEVYSEMEDVINPMWINEIKKIIYK